MSKKAGMQDKQRRVLKVRFYIMSLWLLFCLIFLLTINMSGIAISWEPCFISIDAYKFLTSNVLAIISLLSAIAGYVLAKKTKYEWKGVANPPVEILEVKNENYEYLTFLTTYIIPLICIDLNNLRYVVVLVVLLIVIGFIFVKMDLYYANPTLILMGYHLYRAKIRIGSEREVILISTSKLINGQSIKWIEIDNDVWVAKEVGNGTQ